MNNGHRTALAVARLLFPRPNHKVSDQDWFTIVAASELPDRTRLLVEEAIALYRLAKAIGSSGSSHQVRQLLTDAADSASKLQQRLLLCIHCRERASPIAL
jgi:hypothetical protein